MTEEVAELDTQMADELADATANNIVKNHIIASMTLGLVPIPLFDLAALVTTQMNMIRSLGEYYDVEVPESDMKSLVTSLIAGSLPVLGVVGLSSFAKLIPGVGSLAGSASLSISAGAVTYAVGHTFIMHFESGGTLDDFEPKHAREYFRQQLDKGKQFVKEVKDELKGGNDIAQDEENDVEREKVGDNVSPESK